MHYIESSSDCLIGKITLYTGVRWSSHHLKIVDDAMFVKQPEGGVSK